MALQRQVEHGIEQGMTRADESSERLPRRGNQFLVECDALVTSQHRIARADLPVAVSHGRRDIGNLVAPRLALPGCATDGSRPQITNGSFSARMISFQRCSSRLPGGFSTGSTKTSEGFRPFISPCGSASTFTKSRMALSATTKASWCREETRRRSCKVGEGICDRSETYRTRWKMQRPKEVPSGRSRSAQRASFVCEGFAERHATTSRSGTAR